MDFGLSAEKLHHHFLLSNNFGQYDNLANLCKKIKPPIVMTIKYLSFTITRLIKIHPIFLIDYLLWYKRTFSWTCFAKDFITTLSSIPRQLLRSQTNSVAGDLAAKEAEEAEEAGLRGKRGRPRMAGFSSWAGKRASRGQSLGFSSWAGKRAGGWNWKRAPFNSWAGKRSQGSDYSV